MKIATVFLTAIIMIWSNALSAESTENKHEVGGKHLATGLTCTDCHSVDEPTTAAPMSACTSCHGPFAEVAEITKHIEPNPHDSHQDDIECSACHRTHEPSVNYCNQCHDYDFKMK